MCVREEVKCIGIVFCYGFVLMGSEFTAFIGKRIIFIVYLF